MRAIARSTLRQKQRDEAFARLDAIPLEQLRGQTWHRVAALATTTQVQVHNWVVARGHRHLIGHVPKRGPLPTTALQRQRLGLIKQALADGKPWHEIAEQIGLTQPAAQKYWRTHRFRLAENHHEMPRGNAVGEPVNEPGIRPLAHRRGC